MKTLLYLFPVIIGLCTACENSGSDYDNGYESAWEGGSAPSSFWATKKEKEGYQRGLEDSWTYDSGYDDGYEGRRPLYFKDPLYMDAYKDGKTDKNRGF